ncbi:FlgB family protein [Yoonia maritima]|uniref:FlgB family protein n=1 Tax=Yoonia maritima TaxID=1435347 RepID=UPI000D10CADC|nr:FlgB family protein [Yoonia maritima]
MSNSLDMFQTASAMARHAGARQTMIARNIANADTPGYQTQDVAPFTDAMRSTATEQRATRPGHMTTRTTEFSTATTTTTGEPSPNGNTVAIEDELMKSVEVRQDHDKALAVYRHAMTVLRTSLGKM